MKTAIQTFVCATVISIAVVACDTNVTNVDDVSNKPKSSSSLGFSSSSSIENSSSSKEHIILKEMPVMDSTVVSYRYVPNLYEWQLRYSSGFITDQDILKSWFTDAFWFPNVFDKEQTRECNYFAIYYTGASTVFSYLVLQDMNLYAVQMTVAFEDDCIMTTDIVTFTMLICDDASGNIKNSLDPDNTGVYNVTGTYTDPDWHSCGRSGGRNPFF